LPRDVGVVVVAAGRSTRLGGETPKQYHVLAGVPVLLRAVRPFAAHPEVCQVVVVLPPADASAPPSFLTDVAGLGLTLVAGGPERSDSVASGLAALRPDSTVVLVHDGARPFVDRAVIDSVIRYARAGEAAVAAVPLSDTVKESAADDPTRVERTIPRERLWRAQTPQGFPRTMLTWAHAKVRGGLPATDDAALVEACGGVVRLVPDSIRNLKITTPEDLSLAEVLAEGLR
jgi:2-C-methyl-D-erythritol 4-phosphate cytidylyltransferase